VGTTTVGEDFLDQLVSVRCLDGEPGRELIGVDVEERFAADHVDLRHEIAATRVDRQRVGEVGKADTQSATSEESGDDRIWPAELRLVAGIGSTFRGDGIADGSNRGRGYLKGRRGDVSDRQSAVAKGDRGVDAGVGEVVRGIRLVEDSGRFPVLTEPIQGGRHPALVTEERLEQAESPLDGSGGTGDPAYRQLGGADP